MTGALNSVFFNELFGAGGQMEGANMEPLPYNEAAYGGEGAESSLASSAASSSGGSVEEPIIL